MVPEEQYNKEVCILTQQEANKTLENVNAEQKKVIAELKREFAEQRNVIAELKRELEKYRPIEMQEITVEEPVPPPPSGAPPNNPRLRLRQTDLQYRRCYRMTHLDTLLSVYEKLEVSSYSEPLTPGNRHKKVEVTSALIQHLENMREAHLEHMRKAHLEKMREAHPTE